MPIAVSEPVARQDAGIQKARHRFSRLERDEIVIALWILVCT
jgi:hypothetical protein